MLPVRTNEEDFEGSDGRCFLAAWAVRKSAHWILERLIYARVEPLIDPLLPKEQAGFRRGKSTVDQVVLLTQNIEDSFEAKKKAGAVFIDLTAANDHCLAPWLYLEAAETSSG